MARQSADHRHAQPAVHLHAGQPAAGFTRRCWAPTATRSAPTHIFDGRLRPRQTQSTPHDGKRTITDTQYDGRGLTAKNHVSTTAPPARPRRWSPSPTPTCHVSRPLRLRHRRAPDQGPAVQEQRLPVGDHDRLRRRPRRGDPARRRHPDPGPVRRPGQLIEKRQYSGTPFTGAFVKTTLHLRPARTG